MDNPASLAFTIQKNAEPWDQNPVISHISETPLLSDYPTPHFMASSDSQTTAETTNLDSDLVESLATPSKYLSLDERLESVLDRTGKLGFAHFDWAVVGYYNHTFDDSSSMANEQRMSRNRRLPAVLADIFSAATQWSDWERRGFYEEIIRMTESLLVSEASACHSVLEEKISPLIDTYIKDQISSTPDPTLMRRDIENSVSFNRESKKFPPWDGQLIQKTAAKPLGPGDGLDVGQS